MALHLDVDPTRMDPRHVQEAARLLQSGHVVAYPTDTVYALGVDVLARGGIARLRRLRGLDPGQPLSFLLADLSDVGRWVYVSNFAYRLMRRIFPGPYVMEVEASREVPRALVEKRKRIGIRVPDEPVCQALLRALGRPIVSTSARAPDGRQLESAAEIEAVYGREVAAIVDAGPTPGGVSTVLSVEEDEVVVIREGVGPVEGVIR